VDPVAEDAEGIVTERKKGSADEHIGHRKSATSKPAGTSIGESASANSRYVHVVKNSSVVATTELSPPPRWLATIEPYSVLGGLYPLKHCQKSVVNIPRHLRSMHKWSDNNAKFAVASLGLRNAYKFVDVPKFKDYHCCRKCPIDGCLAVCNLKDAHRILPHTILYKKANAIC